MFLKSLELYGFKSFADKTRLEFSDGTTSLLGPNGCGKSNIVDAIKWVLGEQSTKTLRASKMEDVIFNGTDTRKPLNVAEVTLVIDNQQGLLPLEQAEIEIKRRIFRTGESEFFINRNLVRLKDVRELFFDTGVGKSAYSILEQGKIDQILSTKPEDRRYIFEEAAGITRFKTKSIEAHKKLERTEENLLQVENILGEVKRQYDSRKAQAAKASRYRQLEEQQQSLEIDVQLSAVKALLELRAHRQQSLDQAKTAYTKLNDEIRVESLLLEERQAALRKKTEERIAIQSRLQRIEEQQIGKKEQVKLLQQRYRDFLKGKDEALERHRRIKERIERDMLEAEDQKDRLERALATMDLLRKQIESTERQQHDTEQLVSHHEREIEEREAKIHDADQHLRLLAGQLQELTDSLVVQLDEKLRQSGYSTQERQRSEKLFIDQLRLIRMRVDENRPYAASLDAMRHHKSASNEALATQWERMLNDLSGQLATLSERFDSYRHTIPAFIDDLLAPQGIITRKHRIDEELSTTRRKIEADREAIVQLKEANKGLAVLLAQIREETTRLNGTLSVQSGQADTAKALLDTYGRNLSEQNFLLDDAMHDAHNAQERAAQSTDDMAAINAQQRDLDDEYRHQQAEFASLIALIETSSHELAEQRTAMNGRYERLNAARGDIDKYAFHIENLEQQVQTIYSSFYDSYGKSLKEFDQRLEQSIDDVSVLREQLADIKKQIQQMGYINHMAQEEFSEIKERYDFLTRQTADLMKAKNDLVRVIEEIRTRSEELFMESYQKIRIGFQEMFHRMFGGGRAELRLLDPDHPLESGIDILAQPPGKKLDRLAPLSGGEKSLTAVALLFATYKVKPSPFCILDEIDAALDDRNIGYFLSVLQDFSKDSQFIIITHNKRTVIGSNTLLGVTMQESGVSKAIAWRVGWNADKETIFSQQVDMSSNNTV